jgi:hypothetical protein
MGPMLEMVTQREMERIFQVTDRLAIHRESVVVPLAAREPGRVRRLGAKIEIAVDARDPEGFFERLEAELRKLG